MPLSDLLSMQAMLEEQACEVWGATEACHMAGSAGDMNVATHCVQGPRTWPS